MVRLLASVSPADRRKLAGRDPQRRLPAGLGRSLLGVHGFYETKLFD